MRASKVFIVVFFLFLSTACREKKPEVVEDTGEGKVAIENAIAEDDEKQRFIDATSETTCLVFQAEDLFDPKLKEDTNEIYRSYGFDIENEELMVALTEKYAEDEDLQLAIDMALNECVGVLESYY
ncbi:MAG: hypothetical protein O3B47_05320 [bacterium]|nr:hypothetical protein [bacterium]